MKEDIYIHLRERNNGYSIEISNNCYLISDEIHEERLEVLQSLNSWINKEITKELSRRRSNAS